MRPSLTKGIRVFKCVCLTVTLVFGFLTLVGTGSGDDDTDTPTGSGIWRITEQSTDTENSGEIDEIITYTYDEDGKQLTETTYIGSEISSENRSSAITFTYDAENRKIQTAQDLDGDGVTDEISAFSYNDADQITTEKYYEGAVVKETPDAVFPYTYHADGTYTVEYDRDNNGQIDGENDEIITYEPNGNRKEQKSFPLGDGTFGTVVSIASSYYSNGLIARETITFTYADGEESYTNSYTYTYEAETLRKLEAFKDRDDDGTVNEITYYTWEEI